ncbi:organomercurial lyase [Micromonospora sp. NPDC047812]|uniref:organomercurial lyase n=1 Tax=Micromonospora sp. NPDC047812 TaxID=3155742 RepID=UPI003453F455
MTDRDESVRLAIYRALARTGQPPTVGAVARDTGLDRAAVEDAIEALAAARHLALDADRHIVLAHPFATRNFGFSVMGERTLWWGGCAWDSFAIPHLVPDEPSALVATTCPACGAPHAWVVTRTEEPAGEQVAHFLVPVSRAWDDVVHTCAHQRIFCSPSCVDDWLRRSGHERGAVFGIGILWRLASRWYEGRLDTPYRRREPSEAAAYFASVGLTGPFWGQ